MFKISYGRMFITRGDTASFNIQVKQPDKHTVYELCEGDVLTFTVKKNDTDVEAVIQKTGSTIQLVPSDTNKLAYGRYWYDVQLTFADGSVNTIIVPHPLYVCSEITFGNEALDELGNVVDDTTYDRTRGIHLFDSSVCQLVGQLNVNTYNQCVDECKYNFGEGLVLDGRTLSVDKDTVDKTYIHTQFVASASWTVQHNLNKFPSVTVVDSAGTYVIGEITYNDMNTLTITFSGAFSGKVFCN